MIETNIAYDTQQKVLQATLRAIPQPSLPQPQERFLNGILRRLSISQHPVSEANETPLIGDDQAAESLRISIGCLLHQSVFVQRRNLH